MELRKLHLTQYYNKKIKDIIKNNPKLKLDNQNAEIDGKGYWRKFGFTIRDDWHNVYSQTNGIIDKRYLTEPVFYNEIEPKLNNYKFALAYSDKNTYSSFLKGAQLPRTIIKNINGNYYDENDNYLTEIEAESILKIFQGDFIIKPSLDSGGGRGIRLANSKNSQITVDKALVSFKELSEMYNKDFIIQERLDQHAVFKEMHPDSLNTLRIMTLRHNEQIHIMTAVARFGDNGLYLDNQRLGGVSCGISENGKFNDFAVDNVGRVYYQHPYSKLFFKGVKVPNYNVIINLVKNLHSQLSYFDLISWDIAVNVDGQPIIIELNVDGQEINYHQLNNGPLFGRFTEEIIREKVLS